MWKWAGSRRKTPRGGGRGRPPGQPPMQTAAPMSWPCATGYLEARRPPTTRSAGGCRSRNSRRSSRSVQKSEGEVEHEGQDGGVVREGDGAVEQDDAADLRAGDLHVGDLERHPDGERQIGEVEVRGRRAAGEHDARGAALAAFPVVEVRIAQRESDVGERPGERGRAEAEREKLA